LAIFFFQAEDGIRDPLVTGVQTCALPILRDQRFEGRVAEIVDLHTGGRLTAKRILIVGLGPRAECTPEVLRRAAASAARRARDLDRKSVGEGKSGGEGGGGAGRSGTEECK